MLTSPQEAAASRVPSEEGSKHWVRRQASRRWNGLARVGYLFPRIARNDCMQ